MLEQKFCSRTRVSSSETAYDPRVIKRPAAGCWRCWAFGVKPASRFQRSFHRSAESRPSADEHSNGMAAAINCSGRGGSDFCGCGRSSRSCGLGGPLPARPFTGEKVISASARTRTSPPRIEGEKPQTARYRICGTGTFPVGPIAVTCKITSPSLAHA